MVSLDIKRDVFTDYNLKGEELAVGVDFGELLSVIKVCRGDTRIKLNAEKMQINSGYLSYDLPLITLDALRKEPKLPELEFPATVTIGVEDFKRGINTADTIEEYVEIGVNSEEFFMGVEGSEGKFRLVIPKEDLTLFNVDFSRGSILPSHSITEAKSMFSIDFLAKTASGVVGRLVTLKINNGYPLQIPFTVTDGCEVVYLLAPRIDQ